jgi:type III pantothenate kinase
MLVAFDVGNSGIKAGVFEGGKLLATARLVGPRDDPSEALGVSLADADRVIVSVSDERLRDLEAGVGRGALVLGRDLPIVIENRYRDPSETGHDRLAAAAAAHQLAKGAAIVADLGSAVTVDAVSSEGAFLGGAIAPGRRAFLSGLAAAAPALPPPATGPVGPGLPRSTREAVRAGIEFGLAGLVTRLVEEARGNLGDGPRATVFLTGGDAERISPLLSFPVRIEPHLVLRGAAVLYDRAKPCT